LHWAARCNRTEAVALALLEGIHKDLLQALVHHGADINETLPNGDAALHLAMKRSHQATALALLAAGADIMKVNADGCRPIDCTTSTELQFAIKRAAGSRDVMISYTHSHMEFAKKLRAHLESQRITTWLDLSTSFTLEYMISS
jgi:ankyrin repeat protein